MDSLKRWWRAFGSRPRCVWDAQAEVGENPLWSERERALYWIDIPRGLVCRYRLEDWRCETWSVGGEVGAMALRAGGGMVLSIDQTLVAFDPERGLGPVVARVPGLPSRCRLNDCACDAAGNLWIGAMDRAAEHPLGGLYRITPAGEVSMADDGYVVANGPAIVPAGSCLYLADSLRRAIYAMNVDADGRCRDKRLWVRFDEADGYPDGMVLDSENHLWVAHYGGGRLSRYDPDGRVERTVKLPVTKPTALAFGGDDFATLYVTSARKWLEPWALASQPLAGGLFACDVGIGGRPPFLFAG